MQMWQEDIWEIIRTLEGRLETSKSLQEVERVSEKVTETRKHLPMQEQKLVNVERTVKETESMGENDRHN